MNRIPSLNGLRAISNFLVLYGYAIGATYFPVSRRTQIRAQKSYVCTLLCFWISSNDGRAFWSLKSADIGTPLY